MYAELLEDGGDLIGDGALRAMTFARDLGIRGAANHTLQHLALRLGEAWGNRDLVPREAEDGEILATLSKETDDHIAGDG